MTHDDYIVSTAQPQNQIHPRYPELNVIQRIKYDIPSASLYLSENITAVTKKVFWTFNLFWR